MKICILTHTMPRFKQDTNSASFISELAQGLAHLGHDVIVLTPFDPLFKNYKRPYKVITYKYIWPIFLHKSGYSRVLKGDKKIKPEMYILSTLMSLSALVHLIKVIRKYKIDIVSSHWVVPNGFIAYLASIITKAPYTITIPGSDVFLASKNIVFKYVARFAALNASWVISDSRHYIDQLNHLNILPKHTSVIRYGVDTNFLKPKNKDTKLLSELSINKLDSIVLAMGRFVEKKGFIYLIESMPKILRVNSKIKLVLIGDGELKKDFERKIKELKIEDHVVFTGAVAYSRRAKYYNLSDIFVMPSTKDSMGNIDASPVAMMDAMACGVPVVATKYSGSEDLIINGKTGWMVGENSSEQIAKATINLLKIRNKKQMRSQVRKIAVSNFSIQATSRKYEEIFKNK